MNDTKNLGPGRYYITLKIKYSREVEMGDQITADDLLQDARLNGEAVDWDVKKP